MTLKNRTTQNDYNSDNLDLGNGNKQLHRVSRSSESARRKA